MGKTDTRLRTDSHGSIDSPDGIMYVTRKRLLSPSAYGLHEYENSATEFRFPVDVTLPIDREQLENALALADEVLSEWEFSEIQRLTDFDEEMRETRTKVTKERRIEGLWKRINHGIKKPDQRGLADEILEFVEEKGEATIDDIVTMFQGQFDLEAILSEVIAMVDGWTRKLEEVKPGVYAPRFYEEEGDDTD